MNWSVSIQHLNFQKMVAKKYGDSHEASLDIKNIKKWQDPFFMNRKIKKNLNCVFDEI